MSEKRARSVSVRDLVEFVLRRGNLGGERDFLSPLRALEGTRGHRRIQQSRPHGYESEVAVSHWIESGEIVLTVQGRIDGILRSGGEVLVEEIKTVTESWDGQPDPLHWAQGKIYGFLYLRREPADRIEIQLTYLELESGGLTVFRQRFSAAELQCFFDEVTNVYLGWARDHVEWCARRDESIRALAFPFSEYRPGQRALAVAVYRALIESRRLFAEAPTGIGKTLSVLFPAIKALAEGGLEKVFYLTAKTVGRTVAEKAMAELRRAGLRLRTVTLTARDKICFNEGRPCDRSACRYALGYFDRIKPAVKEALQREELNREAFEDVARRHQVCPFALSLDVSLWADAVVCDYNYVFDPSAYLRRYFADEAGAYAFLIDEAHNLVDRARAMFSADLDKAQVLDVKRAVQSVAPACARALDKVSRGLARLRGASDSGEHLSDGPFRIAKEPPKEFLGLVRLFLKEAEAWLARNQPAPGRESLLQLYFRVAGFVRTAESYDERYATILEASAEQTRLRLFCIDPSVLIQKALQRGRAAVFFSATLSPLDYFREMLGGAANDETLQLPSPFPAENLSALVEDRIATSLKARVATFDRVADAIAEVVSARSGHYLVYFPSHKYLREVAERFQMLHPGFATLAQAPSMTEPEREAFLSEFHCERAETLIGFAVLGGIFGEGIDLAGDRLIGAIIVGVGLPQLCLERDLIRDYFEAKTGLGFEYAYTFPGMNRVLQAAGRVIRSETDRGVVMLIDSRFGQPRYRELFPAWWQFRRVREIGDVREAVRQFWESPVRL